MPVQSILLLGDPRLHEASTPVRADEIDALGVVVRDLHDTMLDFQRRHGWGRAIAAPQIGVARRIVAMNAGEPRTFFNPVYEPSSDETEVYWEDCMSFPDLMVQIRASTAGILRYRDADWRERSLRLTGDFALLLQHELDHLDGVLATERALGPRAFVLRATQPPKDLALRGELVEL